MHRSTPTPLESRWRAKSSTSGPGSAVKGTGFPRRRRQWRSPEAFTAPLLASVTGRPGSFRVEEKAVQEFQGQHFVYLSGIVSVAPEVAQHHALESVSLEVGPAKSS